jgi:hypothetical protein
MLTLARLRLCSSRHVAAGAARVGRAGDLEGFFFVSGTPGWYWWSSWYQSVSKCRGMKESGVVSMYSVCTGDRLVWARPSY